MKWRLTECRDEVGKWLVRPGNTISFGLGADPEIVLDIQLRTHSGVPCVWIKTATQNGEAHEHWVEPPHIVLVSV